MWKGEFNGLVSVLKKKTTTTKNSRGSICVGFKNHPGNWSSLKHSLPSTYGILWCHFIRGIKGASNSKRVWLIRSKPLLNSYRACSMLFIINNKHLCSNPFKNDDQFKKLWYCFHQYSPSYSHLHCHFYLFK